MPDECLSYRGVLCLFHMAYVLTCYNTISVKKVILVKKLPLIIAIVGVFLISSTASANPYGTGQYGEDVGYGSETELSIATDGDVSIPITPTTAGVLGTGTSKVTVTSTDVVGYKLYIRSLTSTDMVNLGTPLPASGNGALAPLAINTWGYKVLPHAPNEFVGITLSDALIRSFTGPTLTAGDRDTEITYGAYIDLTKPAGIFATTVVYTAVPQTT